MKRVALLRGINVGGHRKIPMADLRDLVRSLGHEDAVTYIQSGNVVFTARGRSPVVAARLEEAIASRFGFPVDVVVRTAAEWATHAEANPFPDASESEPSRVFLLVSRDRPRAEGVPALRERADAGESIQLAGGAVWIHYPGGAGKTKLAPALIDRLLGSPTTARNWRTVEALRDLLRD